MSSIHPQDISVYLEYSIASPIVVEYLMFSQEEAMDSLLVNEHLFDIFPLENVIINFSGFVFWVFKVYLAYGFSSAGQNPKLTVLHCCQLDIYNILYQ